MIHCCRLHPQSQTWWPWLWSGRRRSPMEWSKGESSSGPSSKRRPESCLEFWLAGTRCLRGAGKLADDPALTEGGGLMLKNGQATNSIICCWLFTIKDRCKKVGFQQTHTQALHQSFLTVSWDLCAWCSIPDGVLVSLWFQKQRTRRVEGPWRKQCQLKKPFKGPRDEEGKRKYFPEEESLICPPTCLEDPSNDLL